MSAVVPEIEPPRRRTRASIAIDEIVRGAAPEELARPASELLAEVPWLGVTPDPDVVDAATYLAWL